MLDGLAFDALLFSQDLWGPAKVGVRRCHIAQALVLAVMIVMLDEGTDLDTVVLPLKDWAAVITMRAELVISSWAFSRM